MDFIFSQIVGIVAAASAVVSLQIKNLKTILIFQLICNGLGALSYILLDGFSGCGIQLIAVSQTIVCYIFRKNDKKIPVFFTIAFICGYFLCSLLAYESIYDILPAFAALMCALSLIQEKSSMYRMFILFNGSIWIMYDLSVAAYSMLLTHGVCVLSAVIGIIRLDLKAKKEII